MTTPNERLTKILHLEKEKYQDRAVVGGLARYADTWIQEATKAFGPEVAGWIQKVADHLRAYSSLPDPAARQEAMATLLETLEAARPEDRRRRARTRVDEREATEAGVATGFRREARAP